MCEKKAGEPLYSYAFRQIVEKPSAVLACIGLIAAIILYVDLRDLFRAQTDTYRAVGEQLIEVNVRLSEIEQRLNK
ncbi:MAG: hypothetical protein ACI4O9_08075 [Akkermansia sp.]